MALLGLPDLGSGAGSALPHSLLVCCCIAVGVATIMSFFSIYLQLKNYRKPSLQRMVVRILIMVPIYGISSLIAIFSLDAAFVIDAVRDIYEAFVIYCFFQLLLAYLGGERSLLILLQGRAPKSPVFPMNIFWRELDVSDPHTFLFLKRGILQYVQIKPFLAAATLILKSLNIYNEGDFRANSGYLYVSIVYNFSICLSLYCLAMFWVCVHDDLLPFRPMPKFICIKGIIFFSFWQSIFISTLVAAGALTQLGPYKDPELISQALNDTMLCFEMVLFAFGHQYAFSHKDYIDPRVMYVARMPFGYAFRDAFGGRDVFEDTKMTFAGEGMDYKEFEPAEGFMHQGGGRDRRIKAGLRYSKGGKKKYWLPMPVTETEPSNVVNRVGHFLNRNHSEEVYAPILEEQAEEVFRDEQDVLSNVNDDEFPTQGPSDGYGLLFATPNDSDEDLFTNSREQTFGDPNYPNVDVSAESAKKEMWEEEQRILSDERGAYFSPRHEQRKVYFAQKGYGSGATNEPRSRHDSNVSSKSQGKRKAADDDLQINRDDDRLPDIYADGVKLKWTRHGNLKPSPTSSKRSSVSPAAREGRRRSPPTPGSVVASPIMSPTSIPSSGSSPKTAPGERQRTISSNSRSDAIDLVVEDPKAAEQSQARERKRGEPNVRGSGLRKVYKRDYHVQDVRGEEKDVEVAEVRDAPEAPGGGNALEETQVKIKAGSDPKERDADEDAGKSDEPHADVVTELQVVREESPPPGARIEAKQYVDDGDSNPWA